MKHYRIKNKEILKQKRKKWRLENREHIRISNMLQRARAGRRMRDLLQEFFGRKCVCCGIDDSDVLQFDHINNDGYMEQKLRRSRSYLIRQIKYSPNEARKKYQLLCANCNRKKHNYFLEFRRLTELKIPPF
jgi:hypothetical protein